MTLTGSGGESISGITGFNMIRLLADAMVTDRLITEKQIIIYKSILVRLLLEES
jgi:hypothetical protein